VWQNLFFKRKFVVGIQNDHFQLSTTINKNNPEKEQLIGHLEYLFSAKYELNRKIDKRTKYGGLQLQTSFTLHWR
jgi:hypothetical protein